MRKLFFAACVLSLTACGNMEKKEDTVSTESQGVENEVIKTDPDQNAEYASFGEKISADKVLTQEEMYTKYKSLKIGDTLDVKFMAEVASVCKKEGCWMKLRLPEGKEAMVKFKDHGFFVPKDIEEKDAIVHGKAYVTVVPVEEQRHYAKDAGKSEAEIAAITQPKRTLSFQADGVLLKQ